MLNGEFKRIDKERTILSRVWQADGKLKLDTINGDVYRTMLTDVLYNSGARPEIYFLVRKVKNSYEAYNFFTGAFVALGRTLKECLEMAKASAKGDITFWGRDDEWTFSVYCNKHLLNWLSQKTFDTDYLEWLVNEYQTKLKNCKSMNDRKGLKRDIQMIKEFMEGNENDN